MQRLARPFSFPQESYSEVPRHSVDLEGGEGSQKVGHWTVLNRGASRQQGGQHGVRTAA